MAKGPVSTFMFTCTRCQRTRSEQYIVRRKNRAGKMVWRCRKRSVCASKGKRLRKAQANNYKRIQSTPLVLSESDQDKIAELLAN